MSGVPSPTSPGPLAPGADGAVSPPSQDASAKTQWRRLAIRGSILEMVGYGSSQVIRLGSNLVLSRLLFPEAFGLVALVSIFNQGLVMLSDVGIEPAVIQSSRGDDVRFLNTAWTIQVVRGLTLYGVAALIAWPLSRVYREPQLVWLTLAGSLSVLLAGLCSTSLFTLRRRLAVGTLTLIELGSQGVSLLVMIPWAYLRPSAWALVAGAIVSTAVKVVASHAVQVGYRNRFGYESEARRAITHFGKWIFGASAIYFVGRQGDRLLLGRYLGLAQLGVYSIALSLSETVSNAITRITHGVLYPMFSRVREEGEARLRETYYRARLVLDALSLPALGILTMIGPWVIHLLFDKRYAEAGWMLQAFSLRVAMMCMLVVCENCLFSLGQTRFGMYQNIARLVWIGAMVPAGWHFLRIRGLVFAVALSELPLFFVLWPAMWRARMLRPLLELRALGFYCAGLLAGALLGAVLHP